MGWRPASQLEIEQDKAAAWLAPRLAGDPVLRDDIEAAARLEGLKAFALQAAAQALAVIATSDDGERWFVQPGVSHENCYHHEHSRRATWTWSLAAPTAQ